VTAVTGDESGCGALRPAAPRCPVIITPPLASWLAAQTTPQSTQILAAHRHTIVGKLTQMSTKQVMREEIMKLTSASC